MQRQKAFCIAVSAPEAQMDHQGLRPAVTTEVHSAVAQAVTAFEHAVRRHAAAQTELRVARRPSTTKAALKTSDEIARTRLELAQQLTRLGWQPPADVSLEPERTLALSTGEHRYGSAQTAEAAEPAC
jgi:hypothetical protein